MLREHKPSVISMIGIFTPFRFYAMAVQLQRLMDPTKGRSLMQINTALQRMGFCTWADLEPGKNTTS